MRAHDPAWQSYQGLWSKAQWRIWQSIPRSSTYQAQDLLISDMLDDSSLKKRAAHISDLFWLSHRQMARLAPQFPKSYCVSRVDDRRVLSGIIFINRKGFRLCNVLKSDGPLKALHNCCNLCNDMGTFAQMMARPVASRN